MYSFTPKIVEVKETEKHVSVMGKEVTDLMVQSLMTKERNSISPPGSSWTLVDSSLGAGGHSKLLLESTMSLHSMRNTTDQKSEKLQFPTQVLAVDRDIRALQHPVCHLLSTEEPYKNLFRMENGRFSTLARTLGLSERSVDGVLFDAGVSSMQLSDGSRGFSFSRDGPLDMRMDTLPSTPYSARDLVNGLTERQLSNLLFLLGQEQSSRLIARAICSHRQEKPIETTEELSSIIKKVCGRHHHHHDHFQKPKAGGVMNPKAKHKDPATRTFQALRIAVNNELVELCEGLLQSQHILRPDSPLVVLTFHSLEERVVSEFFKTCSSRHRRSPTVERPDKTGMYFKNFFEMEDIRSTPTEPSFTVRFKEMAPSREEIAINPRSRSAKMFVAYRTAAPPVALRTAISSRDLFRSD